MAKGSRREKMKWVPAGAQAPLARACYPHSRVPALKPAAPWRLSLAAGLMLAGLTASHVSPPPAPGQPPREPVPAWGPEMKLEVVAKIPFKEHVHDLTAGADGRVYILSDGKLQMFKDGRNVKSLNMEAGLRWRSMAFDGEQFALTNFQDNSFLKADKELDNLVRVVVPTTWRLLGAASDPATGGFTFSDVHGKYLFVVDAQGRTQRTLPGPNPKAGPDGFMLDLKSLNNGELIATDQLTNMIARAGKDSKVHVFPKVPWSQPAYERAAVVGGFIYMNCLKDRRVVAMNKRGEPVGHLKFKAPQMIGAGLDGFLYLKNGDEILKLKAR